MVPTDLEDVAISSKDSKSFTGEVGQRETKPVS